MTKGHVQQPRVFLTPYDDPFFSFLLVAAIFGALDFDSPLIKNPARVPCFFFLRSLGAKKSIYIKDNSRQD